MKFQRINENVIKCIMTSEEMRVCGVRVEDLMDDRAKAEEFLQYVLSKARYEVDFVTNGDVLNVQLSVMSDGGVSMMISDDQNAAIRAIAEQFKDRLREFTKVLEEAKSNTKELSDTKDYSKEKVIKYFISSEDDKEVVSYSFWSHLSTLDECISIAKAMQDICDTPSDLYKYYDEYFLCIHLSMKKSQIAKYVFIMSEYSDDVSSDQNEYLMIKEHGQIIIKDTALSELSMLA